ncbi:putative ubiquitin-like-specific protease 1B [Platanthera zijinensis]|uniref:Ubiquitin-like-specific protease 1B n=1 Tax=Platanthera zijinensis TaxID=2320716 RepID=A0AAP0BJS1_9ASPA
MEPRVSAVLDSLLAAFLAAVLLGPPPSPHYSGLLVRRALVYISVEEQDLLGEEGEVDSSDFEEENRRLKKEIKEREEAKEIKEKRDRVKKLKEKRVREKKKMEEEERKREVVKEMKEEKRYYKRCGKTSRRLVDHITHDSFGGAEAIMIPCHVASHWVLLVGNLKGKYWDFYDSLPNPMHRSSLRENIRFLHEDRAEVLPGDIIDWPIHTVEGLPTQDNGNDCDIFVMKYMEASLGKDRVDWTRHTSWAKEMPRIRAEIREKRPGLSHGAGLLRKSSTSDDERLHVSGCFCEHRWRATLTSL